ncbi:MAG: tail fiber domain-containing protein [Planctomycetota bacterium]|nr:MAG: tail fiber domain-containing protein [Planctomycetota bacterium]
MKRVFRKKLLVSAIGGILLASSQLGATGSIQDLVEKQDFFFDVTGTQLDLVAPFDFESAELRVRQRGNTEVWTKTFGPGTGISANLLDLVEGGIEDSRYTYEIRFVLVGADPAVTEDDGVDTQTTPPITYQTSGRFNVVNGEISNIAIPGDRSAVAAAPDGGFALSSKSDGDASLDNITDPGNLAVGGYGVFGSDDPGDIIGGKVRILPSGTGSSAYANVTVQSFADNDDPYIWHFGTTGGDFGLQRQRTIGGAKTTVLGIEEDAPASSLVITDSGRIGLGTATPNEALHVNSPNSNIARIKIENTGTAYDLSTGGLSGFRIRELTGPTRTIFGIQPGAPSSSLMIGADGNVGLGVTNANEALVVRRTDGSARIRVQETQAIDVNQQFVMRHNGNTGFRFENTRDNSEWQFRTGGAEGSSTAFIINYAQQSGPEFFLSSSGNLTVKGTVSGGSSRETKTNITNIGVERAIEGLMKLDLHEWSYINSPEKVHVGPMAEDFHEIFGYGGGPTQIAPADLASLALVAAQELMRTNNELKERIKNLELRTEG